MTAQLELTDPNNNCYWKSGNTCGRQLISVFK